MKNSEEAIEKILAGLRDASAPAGMERRIFEALQDHASAQSRWNWRRLSPVWLAAQVPAAITRSVACGAVLVGIFALALAIPIHRRAHPPTQSKRDSVPLETLPPAPLEIIVVSTRPPALAPNAPSKGRVNARRTGFVAADNSVALREMRAVSRPEPPMPLTEQEKLLVRFVQTRRPEELAAVNPVKWAAQDAEEKAEFEKFFVPSTNR